jgi:short-subunit dehydrogenase
MLVVGATSAIAEAVTRLYAAKGARLFLVARNEERLAAIAEDLRIRGASEVDTRVWDAADTDGIPAMLDEAQAKLERFDLALIAYGLLSDQKACEQDPAAARASIHTNFVSVVELLTPLANRLEEQGAGTLAVLTSVAGERGRQSNYVYGAAKAGLVVFLQGLRNRLFRKGVSVVTIKPGFVDTPMTAHFEDKGLVWATPQRVGRGIRRAIDRRKSVAFVPWWWRLIMGGIRAIPEPLFKRMRL